MQTIANIVVGEPDTSPTKPSHIPGVREGNERLRSTSGRGIVDEGLSGKAALKRSTGINAKDRAPIDPRMPRLTPP